MSRGAHDGRITRRAIVERRICLLHAPLERRRQQFRPGEHAAVVGHGKSHELRHGERPAHGLRAQDELIRCALEDGLREPVSGLRRPVDQRRELAEGVALIRDFAVDERAQVEIHADAELLAHETVQGAARSAAVAHACEEVHALAGDPVRRAFLADELAPPTGTGGAPFVLAVGHGACSRDDADAVRAAQRAGPAAHHVVAAAISRRVEHSRRQ
jgi:hypothetical protein